VTIGDGLFLLSIIPTFQTAFPHPVLNFAKGIPFKKDIELSAS
jgi:hypothetical protein